MGRKAPLWGRHILVVEDEAAIAVDIVKTLEDQGATIIGPASVVEDALRWIEDGRIDCALLDIKLGDDVVWPVADALDRQRVPFVFLTGYSTAAVAERYDRLAIQKPYVAADVIDALAKACGRSSALG